MINSISSQRRRRTRRPPFTQNSIRYTRFPGWTRREEAPSDEKRKNRFILRFAESGSQ